MDLNITVLSGRLAADPELKTFDSGTTSIRALVTVRQDDPKRVDVVPVTLWNPTPDDIDTLLRPGIRGERVWVAGSIQRRFWQSDGERSRIEVIAKAIQVQTEGEA